jgi:hypothetical protein
VKSQAARGLATLRSVMTAGPPSPPVRTGEKR